MMGKIVFGRYVVLYNHGGVSVDCDAECLRPLAKIPGILKENFIISKWSRRSDFEAWLCHKGLCTDEIMFNCATIACEPNHPLMKHFIEFLIKNEMKDPTDPQWEEEIQTGPTIFSIFFNNFLDEVFILDPEIIEPWGRITKRTVLNHEYACSWMHPIARWMAPYYLFIRNNFTIILIALIFLYKFRILK
jgi:mannosyltransferase OCH1-like enzyme